MPVSGAGAHLSPIDVTFVVDEKGHVIDDDKPMGPLGGLLDPGTPFPGEMPGLDPGPFLGPELPDGEVAVGDTWETESELRGFGPEPIVATSSSTVTATDEIDEDQVLVIETNVSTTRVEIDLGDLLLGMFGTFDGDGRRGGGPVRRSVGESEVSDVHRWLGLDATTWADPGDGVVRRSDSALLSALGIDITVPDEGTGDLIEGTVDRLSARTSLISSPRVCRPEPI